jgi:putative copper resistance protein D
VTLHGLLIVARAVHFCACALLCGGAGLLWRLRATPGAADARSGLVRSAAVVAVVAGGVWLATTLVIITADPGSLMEREAWSALWTSSFGPPWAIRLGLLAAGLGAAAMGGRMTLPLLTLCGGGLAIDQAWLGHAATGGGPRGALMIASDALHVTAAYAWTGALPVLGLLVVRSPGSPRTARALALFSTAGLLAVGTILATGLINASFRLDSSAQVIGTAYGRLLCVKVMLFATMLGLASINRSIAASDRMSSQGAGHRVLLLGVLAETGLGALVLGIAAILGTTAPPL